MKFRTNVKDLIRMLDELKEMRIWLIFKYTKDGQKMPCWPSTGRYGLKWRNPVNLRTHSEAVTAGDRFHAAGIGFVIPKGFAVVDLDYCYPASGAQLGDNKDGDLNPAARKLVDELGSYTEKSPSGKGLHVIVRADLPAGCKRFDYHLEGGQKVEVKVPETCYVTFTGNGITDSDNIADCTRILQDLFKRYGKPIEDKQVKSKPVNGSGMSGSCSSRKPCPTKRAPATVTAANVEDSRTGAKTASVDEGPLSKIVLGSRSRAYCLAALRGEADRILATTVGSRSDTLFKAAMKLRRYINPLTETEIVGELTAAALQVGLFEDKIRRTIQNGFKCSRC